MVRSAFLFLSLCAVAAAASNAYDFTMQAIDGKPVSLSGFEGKVTLIVNVASQCGYTPQYAALQAIYEKYRDRGFVVAGFPANNFGGQEPGANAEIRQFCERKYHVTFPLFAKISVLEPDQAPLYAFLTSAAGPEIQWNFTKFLVGKNGQVLRRFESDVEPDAPEVIAAIEAALRK